MMGHGPSLPAVEMRPLPRPAPPPPAARRRPPGRASQGPALLKAAGGVAILLAWEIVVRAAAPEYVARPSRIAPAIPFVLSSRAFLLAASGTIGSVLLGLCIALVLGTIAGLAMGRLRPLEWSLRYALAFFYTLPLVAILPLTTLWFGYSRDARLAIVIYAAFLSITINVSDGAKSAPPELLEVARSFRARWYHVFFGITFFSAIPYLLAGIRLAAARALVAAVVAEFFIALDGLGYFILFNSRTFQHDRAFVAVLVLALVAVGIDVGMGWMTRRFLHWRST